MTNQIIESVWDYPRPPKLEKFKGHIRILHKNLILADSNNVYRILETSHPPVYYIPAEDISMLYFTINEKKSFCEWKGQASYVDLNLNDQILKNTGWTYPDPDKRYPQLKNTFSFYASKFDKCLVNDELVRPQEGDFYGGWITSNIKGPFKGAPGTGSW
jgi:uncharacterized protein (DUF427 family)